jgi:hypothetical protein
LAIVVLRCFHLCIVFTPAIEFLELMLRMKHMRIGGITPSFYGSFDDIIAFYPIYFSKLVCARRRSLCAAAGVVWCLRGKSGTQVPGGVVRLLTSAQFISVEATASTSTRNS